MRRECPGDVAGGRSKRARLVLRGHSGGRATAGLGRVLLLGPIFATLACATPPQTGPQAVPEQAPARYGQTTHSPITASVAAHLRAIAARDPSRNGRVFAKVGDSNTASRSFMCCIAGMDAVTSGLPRSLVVTVTHFRVDLGAGVTPFDRQSLCAVPGWSADQAIAGEPSALEHEVTAISPRFAVVMYGTNDIGYDDIWRYGDAMLTLTDRLISWGVIPILSTIPPRLDDAAADSQVPTHNQIVRAIGQARQVPVVDLHGELLRLPGGGLEGDGVHLNVAAGGCEFSPAGLQFGFNRRNLLTLQALERAKRIVVDQMGALDPPGAGLTGAGTRGVPFVIDALPFVDSRNTGSWPERTVASYGCAPEVDESGPEVSYRISLSQATTIRAMVFCQEPVDIDLHLLDRGGPADACIARGDRVIEVALGPGTYDLVIDTRVEAGVEKAGEYLLVVLAG